MPYDIAPLLTRLTTGVVYPAFGGVVVQCVYHHTIPGSGVYDPATGLYTPDTVTDTNVGVILSRYAAEEVGDLVLSTDVLGLIQQSELSFIPREEDSVTIPVFPPLTVEVATWAVESIQRDAARLAWQLQLRKPGA